ncbi:YybH family protein [Actinomadura rugatobispora]|uniref:YybH family protein n=1 Tax=Actinomadura rugatobispora TaxID=1994 RepID=A0ABW1A3U0_9ACTN|nr:hypothetical protein GCM10010200_044890 [Actinomadura rugatobispora]
MATHHVPDPRQTAELAEHIRLYSAAYGTSAEELDRLYEDRALLVPRPGHPVTGSERLAAHRHMIGMGTTLEARPRHTYVVDDIALLVVDWTMKGTTPDGQGFQYDGTAADVARQGRDGRWRYVIDNPFGTAS